MEKGLELVNNYDDIDIIRRMRSGMALNLLSRLCLQATKFYPVALHMEMLRWPGRYHIFISACR